MRRADLCSSISMSKYRDELANMMLLLTTTRSQTLGFLTNWKKVPSVLPCEPGFLEE
jgi:hypothetical protein